jgi:enoyl-CoA hydratase/carnithine racemase
VSVPRRIGRWRAAWLMLTGERLAAQTALRWGLADKVTDPVGELPSGKPVRHLQRNALSILVILDAAVFPVRMV